MCDSHGMSDLPVNLPVIAPQCKHYGVCGSPAHYLHDGQSLCVLHAPTGDKDLTAAANLLANLLAGGQCDFRWMWFGNRLPAQAFADYVFLETADFSNVTAESVAFPRTTFRQDVIFEGARIGKIILSDCVIQGTLGINTLHPMSEIRVIRTMVEHSVTIASFTSSHVDFEGSVFEDAVSVTGLSLDSLSLVGTIFRSGFRVRGEIRQFIDVRKAAFSEVVDLQSCRLNISIDFDSAVFTEGSVLDVRCAYFRDGLSLSRRDQPSCVFLDGAVLASRAIFKTPMGQPKLRIIAQTKPPEFKGVATSFVNVDLSECRLLGNSFANIELSDVTWALHRKRAVLYEEIVVRSGGAIPLKSLQEAYQVLKRRYEVLGDHVIAGDFHYGEIEMRRHRSTNIRSIICWEFVYWLFSGYGTRPNRAVISLVALVFASALLFWLSGSFPLLSDALQYSVAVSTFLKVEPDKFTPSIQLNRFAAWVQLVEATAAVVLIALFVLALRTRLRR